MDKPRDTDQLDRCGRHSRACQRGPVELLRHRVQSNNLTPLSQGARDQGRAQGNQGPIPSILPGSTHSLFNMSQVTAATGQPPRPWFYKKKVSWRSTKDWGGIGQGRKLKLVSHGPLPCSGPVWAVLSVRGGDCPFRG